MDILYTRIYERKISKLLSSEELLSAENEIIQAPEKWPVIPGTGGVRKARAAKGNKGKSGGVRIMYYLWMNKDGIYFMDVYPKNEKENLSEAEKKLLKKLIEEFKRGEYAKEKR